MKSNLAGLNSLCAFIGPAIPFLGICPRKIQTVQTGPLSVVFVSYGKGNGSNQVSITLESTARMWKGERD